MDYKLRAACLHSDELYTYILLTRWRSLRYNKNSVAPFLFARFEVVKPVCWYPENAEHLVTVPSLDNHQILAGYAKTAWRYLRQWNRLHTMSTFSEVWMREKRVIYLLQRLQLLFPRFKSVLGQIWPEGQGSGLY